MKRIALLTGNIRWTLIDWRHKWIKWNATTRIGYLPDGSQVTMINAQDDSRLDLLRGVQFDEVWTTWSPHPRMIQTAKTRIRGYTDQTVRTVTQPDGFNEENPT